MKETFTKRNGLACVFGFNLVEKYKGWGLVEQRSIKDGV